MRMLLGAMIWATTLAAAAAAGEGGMINALPDTNAWARYSVEVNFPDSSLHGQLIVKSTDEVGSDQLSRWLEFNWELPADLTPPGGILKLQLPATELREGNDNHHNASEIWYREGTENPVRLETIDGDLKYLLVATLLSGPLENVEPLAETRRIVVNGEELECRGVLGTTEVDYFTVRFVIERRIWLHDSLPFGTASTHLDVDIQADGESKLKTKVKLEILETGEDAVSDI